MKKMKPVLKIIIFDFKIEKHTFVHKLWMFFEVFVGNLSKMIYYRQKLLKTSNVNRRQGKPFFKKILKKTA